MLSFQIFEALETITNVYQNESYKELDKFLGYLSELYISLQPDRTDLLVNFSNSETNSSKLLNYSNSIVGHSQEIKTTMGIIHVFNTVSQLIQSFSNFQERFSQRPEIHPYGFSSVLVKLRDFQAGYERFLVETNPPSILSLLRNASELREALQLALSFSTLIALSINDNNKDDQGSLSLVFESSQTYRDFVEKLDALQRIYSIFCDLLNVSEADSPLTISKIESGSLWVQVFGHPKILDGISSSIDKVAGYFYRTKTKEGKISSLPKKAEVLEEMIDLKKMLDEAGIDSSKYKEKIERSAILLAEEFNRLLSDEPSVVLNGELLQVGSSKDMKLLESRKQNLIEAAKDVETDKSIEQ